MRERPAVAQDRGPEPAKAERVRVDPGAAEPARDQTDRPRRGFERLLHGHFANRPGQGVDEPDLAVSRGDPQDRERAVLQLEDRRAGDVLQPPGVGGAHDARPQLEKIGGANQILSARRPAGQGQLVAQLQGVGRNPVVGGDEGEGGEPAVDELRPLNGLAGSRLVQGSAPCLDCRPKSMARDRPGEAAPSDRGPPGNASPATRAPQRIEVRPRGRTPVCRSRGRDGSLP